MKILFWGRKSKRRKWATLYCRITVNRIRAKTDFSTGIEIPNKKWDSANQKTTGPEWEWVNLELAEISAGIRGIAAMLRGRGGDHPDADMVRAEWLKSQNPAPEAKLYDLFLEYEAGQKRTEASGRAQARRAEILGAFIKESGDRAGMQAGFEKRFEKLGPAMRQKHLYYLNAFLSWAAKKGHSAAPLDFKIRLEKKPLLFLSKEQMEAVIAAAPEGPEKDFMLLMLCTGLAFADTAGIGPANMKDAGGNLGFYLEVTRKKSGGVQIVPLMGRAAALLEKWGGAAPPVRYDIYSVLLARWGEAAGLPFKFTSHVCRKTCATMLYSAGVPLSHVSRILGHSSTKITEAVYARLDVESIIRSVRGAGF